MSVEEFHEYLGVPQTRFSERVFGILDLDGSGALDFGEFAVGVWNYCTYVRPFAASVLSCLVLSCLSATDIRWLTLLLHMRDWIN